ncbi:MAG: hypothetical protein IJB31_03195 [Akkermansia sp.]|nr:hypothetical protein [Akkermansia sp.]
MVRKILIALMGCVVLSQCNTMKSDCEALRQREQEIAAEQRGDYYVGRRYYVPLTRFWGYLREPGKSWRTSRLVIMDESVVRTPDRGYEPPVSGATFGTDQNIEYMVKGSYTGENAYDPSTDQILPVFKATSYTVRNEKPGFLFVPSEEYDEETVTLLPRIMPTPQQCAAAAQ